MKSICFHCNEPIPSSVDLSLNWQNQSRDFCCIGCKSVAEAIIENKLDDYYKFRTEVSVKPDDLIPQQLRDIELLDDAKVQQSFTQTENSSVSTELGVEGITCAACSWLIESRLQREPGIEKILVNPVTRRISLKWNQNKTPLSHIIKILKSLGYKAYPFRQNKFEQQIKQENRSYLIRLGIAGLGMMQVMMFAVGLYLSDGQDIDPAQQQFLHWISALIATPVVFYSGFSFFRNAYYGLKAKHLNMDVPVAIALVMAYTASMWATVTHSGQVYFDSVSMFVFFLLTGRYLEHRVRLKACLNSQAQRQTLPLSVTKKRDDNSHQQTIPLHQVNPKDVLVVASGETLPTDGKLASSYAKVNESLLTGESVAVDKYHGDQLLAGSINEGQLLELEVTEVGDNTYFSALNNMSERALANKPHLSKLADKLAHWFVMGILLLVTVVYFAWNSIDPSQSFWIALSVLVVSCPCALSLATPTAVTSASQALAKLGLLLIKPDSLEALAKIDTVAFDKTGTLTEGKPVLTHTDILINAKQAEELFADAWPQTLEAQTRWVLDRVTELERNQHHPIALAFKHRQVQQKMLSNIEAIQGQGIKANYKGLLFKLGKLDFVLSNRNHISQNEALDGTQVWLSYDDYLIAHFVINDAIKTDAKELIANLESEKYATLMLSGDHAHQVQTVAQQLKLQKWFAACLPQEKSDLITKLQQKGHHVLMVGDGLNDSVVLAAADVGIAINTATDLTQSKADGVLTSHKIQVIFNALMLARKTQKIIKQNLFWALSYNLIAIPFAALGFVPPWLAAIGMTLSSLVVLLNAQRLKAEN